MRISFFGSSLLSAYWNGAATYYRGILAGLAAHGHQITFYEPDAYDRQAHRDIEPPSWCRVVVYQPTDESAAQVLEQARWSDVIVKASGVGVLDDFLEHAVLAVRRPSTAAIFWDVDAPATLDGINADPRHPMRELIPRYDLVLTYGGGAPVIDAYRALGARACIPVYNALDPATHHPVPAEDRFACDLALVANRLPDREARIDDFFFAAAQALPDKRFLLGGSGWETRALPANVQAIGHVYTADHNPVNCSALAVLNVNRASMARYGFSPPTRIFEAAGAGACIVSDRWAGIDRFLQPGREILVADDGEAVARHLRDLDAAAARRIGDAARQRILAEHTYAHRAALVDALLRDRAVVAQVAE